MENLVAAFLLKRLQYWEDREGNRWELRYIRDKEGREVDFALVKDGMIEELVEVKQGDENPSRSLRYYAERLKPKRAVQIVSRTAVPFDRNGIRITDPLSYFTGREPR